MMEKESIFRKIWNVIYPVIKLFVIYFAVVYGGIFLFSSTTCAGSGTVDDYMNKYFSLITIIALAVIIVVEYIFYRNDYVAADREAIKKPVNIAVLIVFGAALSHGMNLLVSLFNINGIFGSYEAVEAEIFAPGVIFVIIRAMILAPLAEELVFRALVFRRLKGYTNFWVAALVSSALFGLYHMNLGQGIYAFLFGIALSAVYDRFRNYFAPVLVHFAANLLSVILQYSKAAYPQISWYIVAMVVTLAVSAVLYVLVIRKIGRN